jgi:hypothetical protein
MSRLLCEYSKIIIKYTFILHEHLKIHHRTSRVYVMNITCIPCTMEYRKNKKSKYENKRNKIEYQKVHRRTTHLYHAKIKNIIEYHMYTTWITKCIIELRCILVNITCILHRHHKIYHRTSHIYHMNMTYMWHKKSWNTTCILHEHHKKHHKIWVYHVNIEKYTIQHHMYTIWT